MDSFASLLGPLGEAALQLLKTPYLYASLLLVVLIYRRQIVLQRKLFYARFHSLPIEWIQTVIWGLLAGILATVILFACGASLQAELLPVLWILALLLMVVRLRFVCFAYVIGLTGVVAGVFGQFPKLAQPLLDLGWLDWLIKPLLSADLYSLFLLVGVLHFIEALLVRFQGARMGMPMFFLGKRGKLIGGYHFQRFWPVPLLLMAPIADYGSIWAVWSDPDKLAQLLVLLPFPVIIGFSDMTVTKLPQQKTASTANGLFVFSFLTIGLAVTVKFFAIAAIPAAVLIVLAHEALRWFAKLGEDQRSPFYTNSSSGLKVLAVLPRSAAEALGIEPGEIIHKVNGFRVQNRRELFDALRLHPAYCKLEVFNLDGQLKFLKRALFTDDHHQLGVVLAPDDDVQQYAEFREYSLFAYLRFKLGGVFRKDSE